MKIVNILFAAGALLCCHGESSTLQYFGSVEDVIAGNVPKTSRDHFIKASDFNVAFEVGSTLTDNWNSLGEFLAVNGYAYSRNTDSSMKNYYKPMSGETFITTGVVMVPKGVSPTTTEESKTELGFNAVYDNMYQKIERRPYCFCRTNPLEKA